MIAYKTKTGKRTGMVVSVYMTTTEQTEIRAYTLLDTQSDAPFITQKPYEDSGATGTDAQLWLSTMAGEDTPLKAKRVDGLKIRGLYENTQIKLPTVYTTDFIPADLAQIPTLKTADKWPHPKSLTDNRPGLQDCEVGLLISYNCPSALAPLESITGQGDQPFAIQTALGWSIVGAPTTTDTQAEPSLLVHRIITYHDKLEEKPVISTAQLGQRR